MPQGASFIVDCPYCKQPKGQVCIQMPSGKKTKPHAPRYILAALEGWEPKTRST